MLNNDTFPSAHRWTRLKQFHTRHTQCLFTIHIECAYSHQTASSRVRKRHPSPLMQSPWLQSFVAARTYTYKLALHILHTSRERGARTRIVCIVHFWSRKMPLARAFVYRFAHRLRAHAAAQAHSHIFAPPHTHRHQERVFVIYTKSIILPLHTRACCENDKRATRCARWMLCGFTRKPNRGSQCRWASGTLHTKKC